MKKLFKTTPFGSTMFQKTIKLKQKDLLYFLKGYYLQELTKSKGVMTFKTY